MPDGEGGGAHRGGAAHASRGHSCQRAQQRGSLRAGGYLDRLPEPSALERVAYRLHAFGYSWYVFNIADVAIVAGVALLLYESLIDRNAGARRGNA